jgi:glutamate-1-semialdehyde 2,1-aminomutase
MLKLGYLASTTCYLSTSHSIELIDKYIEDLQPVFKQISECEKEKNKNINELLDSSCCHDGFKRLN